jgi:NADH-quinone oxidoreductase subunit C
VSAIVLERLRSKFLDAIKSTTSSHGDETAIVEAGRVVEILRHLMTDAELKFDFLVDLTCNDTLGLDDRETGRFEVVYHLRSMASGRRVRIKARIDEGPNGENPEIDSIVPLWKGANWLEREAWDLFGVRFIGHPDPRRILMYEEFIGHPLRKDYPKEKRQPLVRRDYT